MICGLVVGGGGDGRYLQILPIFGMEMRNQAQQPQHHNQFLMGFVFGQVNRSGWDGLMGARDVRGANGAGARELVSDGLEIGRDWYRLVE